MSIVRKLSTQCILLSSENTEDTEGRLFKEENTVCCDRLRMPFDAVFDAVDDFKTTAYDLSLSSLTKKTLKGESGICILCGDRNETSWMELLRACVTELLEATARPEKKVGVIKLCWFTVGADGAENLADVLKPLGTPQAAHKNISLVLRDLTGGRGTTVPGLVEVELSSIEDLEKVFDQLQSLSSSAYEDTSSHSIVQISFTDARIIEAVRVRKKDFVAQGALRDPAGLGRITFLQLSNLRSQGPKPLATTSNGLSPQRMQCPLPPTRTTLFTRLDPPSEPVKIDFVTEAGSFYPWIEHSRQVLQWMENKRASTPFHRSRLLLLLKDVLLRRQTATMLLCLRPSAAQRSDHEDWLRVVWLISRDFAPVPAVTTPSASIVRQKHSQVDRQQESGVELDYTNSGENVDTASVTWVYPGEDESTVHSQSAYSSSPSRSSLMSPSKQHSPADTDSIHWRAVMRARALDYGRAHTPRRRSRSNSRSNSRRQSRTESPRSPSEAQISPHTANSSKTGGRSRVNSVDSLVSSVPGNIEGGWDRTTTPGRSSSLHRVRLQLQTELSPLSHTAYTDDSSDHFHFENYTEGGGQGKTTISPTPSALSSQTSGGTPSALAHQKRFFRSTLERIEGQIFEGAHGAAPVSPAKRTKPVSPKPRVKHLTFKEMSAAMRALANRNKKLAESAAKDKDELLGSHDTMNSSSAGATAEVEDLKKRLAEAQGRCTTLETEQGVPLTYPTYDPNLFYTKWGPISPNKRRASVQTFLQARGAAVDPLGLPFDPANSRSQDSGHREMHHDVSLRVASRSYDSDDREGVVVGGGGATSLNRIFGEAPEENVILEEQEDTREENPEEKNKEQSVEEQLRQALESLRVLGIKYEDLECKYNALLASRSAQQMQDNPMSATRPLSVRSKLNPSPPADVSVPPTRSPLTMLFPSDEPVVEQSHVAGESVVSVPAARTTPPAQEMSDDDEEVKHEHQPVTQSLRVDTAEAALAWRSAEAHDEEEANIVVMKTHSEQPFVPPSVSTQSTVAEGDSGAVVTNSAQLVPPISPTPSTSADSERRASALALARTSIRTSPIPLDSIPSVSPIRFQRTRRAPREPVATPFESSFQASDFSEEIEQVVVTVPAVATFNAPIDAETATKANTDKGDIVAAEEEAFVKLEKEQRSIEQTTVAPSVLSEALAAELLELHVSEGRREENLAADVVPIPSETETQQVIPEEPEAHSAVPPESVTVHSTSNVAEESREDLSIPAVHEPMPAVNTVDGIDGPPEEIIEKRPVSSRPRFQPRRSSITSKPSGNSAGESPARVGREDSGSIATDATHANPSVQPPSPLLPPSDSPAVKVAKRHMSVTFEQNVIDAEPSVKETHLQDRDVLAAPPSPPRQSPPQPPTIEVESATVARDPPDQAIPELATEEAMPDNVLDITVSEETTRSKVESAESAEGEIVETIDELAVPILEFPPEAKQAEATEQAPSVEELTDSLVSSSESVQPHHRFSPDTEQVSSFVDLLEPVTVPMDPPQSSPESIQPHHRFSQKPEQASPADDLMVPVLESMGPPVSSPESVQPHHRFSISKTRFPQFLQQRLDDSLSSDGASDNEREIFEDFPFLPRETRADSMIEELEYEYEFVEAINHTAFNGEKNEDGNDDDQSETALAAGTMQEPSQTSREEVSAAVEIAAVKIDIDQGETPHAASTLPSQAVIMVDVVDTTVTEEALESATVHLAKNQAIAAQGVSSPPVIQPFQEANQITPAEAIFPSLQVPAISSLNPAKVNLSERPPIHHEGMYAQLAHATSPARHETISSSYASSTESAQTRDEAHRSRPSSVPLNSTETMPAPSRTNICDEDVFSVTNESDVNNRNLRTFSMDDTAGEEAEPFDENTLQDSPCPVPSVLSDADSQPALPVPVGMYGQLAHSSSPVRPVSVPIPVSPVSSGDDALADKTKPLKTSRWSWLKKKST